MTETHSAASRRCCALLIAISLLAVGCTNVMKMKMPSGFDDTVLESRIKEVYWSDPELANSEILVTAKSGAVELQGAVATQELKRRAESVARKVAGVLSVTNSLTVNE